MAEQPSAKRVRRPNFSEAASLALVEAVTARRNVIMSKLDNEVTARAKAAAWEEVKQAVNAVYRVSRDMEEIKRKFKALRVAVKKKASQAARHMEGTGR